MIELPILNLFGWLGFAGLMAFYWMIGTGRPAAAYLASTFGAAAFLVVGVASQFGYAAHLPSLWIMESCVIALNVRALVKLRAERRP
jgi:hypothetical protein